MKKYILLIPLALFATINAQDQLMPELIKLTQTFGDLSSKLTASGGTSGTKRKTVNINNVVMIPAVLVPLQQTGGTPAQQADRRVLAQDTMDELKRFVASKQFTATVPNKTKVQDAVPTILNANPLTIVTAIEIFKTLGKPQQEIYAVVGDLFQALINKLQQADAYQRTTVGFRQDLELAQQFPAVLEQFIQEARASSDSQSFIKKIDDLQERLIQLSLPSTPRQ